MGDAVLRGAWCTNALAPGQKESRQAMEIDDDDATQSPEDSQIWLGMGVAPSNGDAVSRYGGQSS
jgi:hypothetical protein